MSAPVLDLDVVSCYADMDGVAGGELFLTREVTARHLIGRRCLEPLGDSVARFVRRDPLAHPREWQEQSFLGRVGPPATLTTHIEYGGAEATPTTLIVEGSIEPWVTGFDVAAAAVLDDKGRVPELSEAWVFQFGRVLRGMRPQPILGGLTIWDPRRPPLYHSRDGRVFGTLGLAMAAARMMLIQDPDLDELTRYRRREALKTAGNSAVYGAGLATVARPGAKSQLVWTADGALKVPGGEQPGAWGCPLQSAMVVGAARLAVTLGMAEARRV